MTAAAVSAELRWTGHALVDVGLAGVCAYTRKPGPEAVTLEDLDAVADFLVETYYSGALGAYLTCVFMNASFVQPKEGPEKRAAFIGQYLRAHRAQPDARVAGARCAFSGEPATCALARTHLPLFSGEDVLNFRPEGETWVPAAGAYVVALMFLPMAGRRAEGKLLLAHADDPELTLAFAGKYLADNRRLLHLALPAERSPVHPEFERELPQWDATRKRYKMADVKGPRSLVLHDLTDIAGQALPTDVRPTPTALNVYLLSNSGQGPSLDWLAIPSGVVAFIRRAAEARTRAAWHAITRRFAPLEQAGDEAEGAPRKRRRKSDAPTVAGRAGWTKNPAFENLCRVFEGGFTDRALARQWLARYVLGRIESRTGDVRFEATRTRTWALADLFLREVLGMKAARIEAVKRFADKLAKWIVDKNDRRFYRTLVQARRLHELREALVRRQRESAGELFGLDEYAAVWLHEDGDEYLVRDLVCIRVVERLGEAGWFASHPEEALAAESEGTDTGEEASA